jgi:hypothetical protein
MDGATDETRRHLCADRDELRRAADQSVNHPSDWDDGRQPNRQPYPVQPLSEAAYQGLANDFVRLVAPESEADPAGLLLQFLTAFGNAAGRNRYFQIGGTRHYPILFVVMVAETAAARKGSSWAEVRRLFELVDEDWTNNCIDSGLSSGEGLIERVRDPMQIRRRNGTSETDGGITDKRLLVFETEFSSVLKNTERRGNKLTGVLRSAWDCDKILRTMTRGAPLTATDAHISLVAHVSPPDLKYLSTCDATNGTGNRFLWAWLRRSQFLPFGGKVDRWKLDELAHKVRDALAYAQKPGEIDWADNARVAWRDSYGRLTTGHKGLVASVLARAEAQCKRVAMVYALMDCSNEITYRHLAAAFSVWQFNERVVKRLYGDGTGDVLADSILVHLREAPRESLTRSEISGKLGHHVQAAQIQVALKMLTELGMVQCDEFSTAGRPLQVWRHAKGR